MEKQIKVLIKLVYGKQTIYPVCEDAVRFTQLTGNKTLSQENIATIKALGYGVAVQPQTL